ncbi:MAG: NADH:flavin oxidoreductase [Epsilonproteobacteria bacterium]|nr:NADH:flavin oxidoreductase [Campylobacterota bacterium]
MQTDSILFSPVTIGNLTIPNRIVMAPMTRSKSPQNIPTKEVVQYYKRRAEGGTGLIITEGTFIDHPVANGYIDVPAFYGDALPIWKEIVKEVHTSGAKIIPQIWHTGTMRALGISPNPQMLSVGPMDQFTGDHQTAKAMTQQDIDDVIHAFTQAAVDAKTLGFDGVEVHGAHGYLIDQFLWQKSNQRADNYGGNLENRMRFACEIVKSIREAVGEAFPIIFRFSQWKAIDYDAKIVQTPEELEEFLTALIDAGVDIFHASQRRFWTPAFDNSPLSLAGWVKKITGKPVINVGGVGIDEALNVKMFEGEAISTKPDSITLVEKKLQNKEFDLIAVGRALLADPNWTNKMRDNHIEKVLPFSSKSLETLR